MSASSLHTETELYLIPGIAAHGASGWEYTDPESASLLHFTAPANDPLRAGRRTAVTQSYWTVMVTFADAVTLALAESVPVTEKV